MSRYRGPRFKKIRRLGSLPGLTNKELPLPKKIKKKFQYRYRIRLQEKQKLRFHYGLTERQLLKYVRIAGKAKGPTGQVLLQLLEMRLDNILFRLGMASTIPGARQLVNHRHILVNGRIIDIPSYRCKPRDIITVRDKKKSRALIQNSFDIQKSLDSRSHKRKKMVYPRQKTAYPRKIIPSHLTLKKAQYQGLVHKIINTKWVGLEIKELLVVEYYSRQTKT